jgi:transglutaminase-like putative cysteine protease
MMIYDVGLTVTYAYDSPAVAGRHLLRLTPAELPGAQRRSACWLEVAPEPAERRGFVDFFGNAVEEIAFREAHAEIAFRVSARVERLAQPPELDLSPDLPRLAEEVAGWRGLGPDGPHHFLGPSPRVPRLPEAVAFARPLLAPGMTAMGAVRAVGEALHAAMAYDPDATTVDTPPGEALALRRGVCQDFAQVMIACLRGIGLPAGYVSGFLRTIPPPGKPRMEGADAMHAWVRAWCGWESGWIEYDPTNALVVGADHIEVARGRDYGDVAPVVGVLRISGAQTTEQAVDVLPVEPAG